MIKGKQQRPAQGMLLLMLPCLFPLLAGQERVHERIEVIYQEILVRVFDGGRPITGLKAGDFLLYEDGRPVKVAYCRELRRSLAQPENEPGTPAEAKARPRLFLFMLWFNEESREWPKAWEYFLEKVYRPGDRVVLSDGAQVLELSSLDRDKEKTAAFFASMNVDLHWKRLDKIRLVGELEKSVTEFHEDLVFSQGDREELPSAREAREKSFLHRFQSGYLAALNEYRLARLKGRPAWLENLAGALKAVEAEKWALVFLQNERLPLLHRDSRLFRDAPMLQETLSELKRFMEDSEREIKLNSDVMGYLRDLRPLFVGANATYHVFLSDTAGDEIFNEHLQWQPVFSSWEGTFRQISADTGGKVINSTRLGEALRQAAEREDVYYVLTFKPSAGDKRRRDIKVDVKRPGLNTVYSRKLQLGELFPLKIQAMEWWDGKLTVSLADYQRTYGEEGLAGKLQVSLRAAVSGGAPLTAAREVTPKEPAADVAFALNFPTPGHYLVEVEVSDLLTGNRTRSGKEIDVAPPPAPVPQEIKDLPQILDLTAVLDRAAELDAVLQKAAGYCRRLKEAAFRFYCLEKVEERILERDPLMRRVDPAERRWHYDYQITGADGMIQERRRLILDGTHKVEREDAALETRFSSHYSVFLPVTLLAVENRREYSYRFIEREEVKDRRCAVVEVLPSQPQSSGIAQGKVWIDEADGSVLKIEMSPRGISGMEALEKAARKMSAELILNVIHWYLVGHDGLRFPSETQFIEQYRFDKSLANRPQIDVRGYHPSTTVLETRVRFVEFYRLQQRYEDYRFFEVESREEIHNLE
ncbi:MAG: hypothetical protein JXO51_02845 [Candidatus Aminicenantes bacterium]|nr:hypothetical protein [Candidatus Aminicenantes bacterium]